MRTRRVSPAAAAALFLLGLGLAAPASAADVPEVLRLRAESLLAEGRCSEALALLERAGADPAPVAQLRGRCAIRDQRWSEAVAALEEAQRLDPALPELNLELGIARFHQGEDLGAAAEALAAARAATPDAPAVALYEGLVALERADVREAALRLEAARRAGPLEVEPVASYYAGIAWQRAREQEKAREALERVQRESPGTPWAQAAAAALTRAQAEAATRGFPDRRDTQAVQQADRPLGTLAPDQEQLQRWAAFSVGAEYDDNVVLRGSGVELPSDIANDSDARLVFTAEAGMELFRSGDWSGGVIAAYYGSAHEDLNEFNSQYPTLTGWLDRRLDEANTLRLQYDFGYAWVDADPFLLHHTFTPALFHDWGESGTTRLFVSFDWNNFLFGNDDVEDGVGVGLACPTATTTPCAPAGLNEESARNRDGFGMRAGLDHVYRVNDRLSLRGGYRYHRYSSRGREWSSQAHEGILGLRARLPLELVLDVQGSYTYEPYRNPSTFPDPPVLNGFQYALSDVRRREDTVQVDVIVERPVNEWLTASVRYSYVDNDSNRDVFDYDRNIFGGYLTVRFQR